MSHIGRRGFLLGLVSAFAAPAIVRATSLMPVRAAPLIIAPEAEILIPGRNGLLTGRNGLLTVNMITREAIRMFKNSNLFLKEIDLKYGDAFYRCDPRVITHAL